MCLGLFQGVEEALKLHTLFVVGVGGGGGSNAVNEVTIKRRNSL